MKHKLAKTYIRSRIASWTWLYFIERLNFAFEVNSSVCPYRIALVVNTYIIEMLYRYKPWSYDFYR